MLPSEKNFPPSPFENGEICESDGGDCCWFILRYKVISKNLKVYLNEKVADVFFPFRKIRRKNETTCKVEYIEEACVPGYIFVRGPLERAKEIGKEVGLFLWKNHSKQGLYHSISNKDMERFRRVVSLFQDGINMYSAKDIDVEQDDEVEFVSGPLEGQHGYIKIQKGKSGGVIIVPLTSDCNSLHYGIKASPTDYRIVRFADVARHNDSIKQANLKAKALLNAYREGLSLSEKDCIRLKSYAIRYANVETATNIQRAQLTLLLYRIYIILEDYGMCEKIKQQISNVILPDFDLRYETVRGDKKERIAKQKEKLLQEIAYIESTKRR